MPEPGPRRTGGRRRPSSDQDPRLRHSYASALLAADVPMKVISERLRHAGIGITADLYTHMSDDVDRAHAEAGAALILGT